MKRRTFLQFIGLASVSGAAIAKGVDLPARKPYEFDSMVEEFGGKRSGNNLGPDTSQRMAKAWMEGIEADLQKTRNVGSTVSIEGDQYKIIMADADGVRVSRIY